MSEYYGIVYSSEYLEHFGIKGQKWGIRRYQNDDGTLTEAGRKRYRKIPEGDYRKLYQTRLNDLDKGRAENLRDIYDMDQKREYYEHKSRKAKTDEKHDIFRGKAYEIGVEEDKKIQNVAKIDEKIQKYIAAAENSGYTVKQIESERHTVRGKSMALKILAYGAASALTFPKTGLAFAPLGDKWVPGTHYKVKQQKQLKQSSGPAVMLTSEEAKKLGLGDSTRITGKEESDFWKAYAKQVEEQERRRR